MQNLLIELQYIIDTLPEKLLAIPKDDFSRKPLPEKWSKKEILGHLIDSATNNHHRFVMAQFDNVPVVTYNQDNWNAALYYQDMDSKHVIAFWAIYNQHLVEVIKNITADDLQRECNKGGEKNVTL